ncbi:MAG: hypothetical protein HKN82_03580 [Akkermansiaceae bacterium]|nr:hypothetical protein [Akkermansiaceae bacterium]NNM28070.1 hypothetical protein [Akkermansiaceae bacterium]
MNFDQLIEWSRSRDTPVAVQFVKFGICGFASLATFVALASLLVFLFRDFVAPTLPPGTRALHLNILHLAAFVPANLVAYATNRTFVFTPGRHKTHNEFALFTLIAVLSYFAGLSAPEILIRAFNVPNWFASAGFVITSGIFNFVTRKLFIFAR